MGTRDRPSTLLRAASSPERLKLLRLAAPRPVSVKDISAEMGISEQRVRYYARSLMKDGLLFSEVLRNGSRGQPARLYRASPDGLALIDGLPELPSAPLSIPEQRFNERHAVAIAVIAEITDETSFLLDSTSGNEKFDLVLDLMRRLPSGAEARVVRLVAADDRLL